jgi:hypothetical protein
MNKFNIAFFHKAFLALVLSFFVTSANAGLKFGEDDMIHNIGTTTLQGPSGEKLYIGRLTTMKVFLLPYSIEDKGYVLGVVGDNTRYFNFPDGEFLEQAQKEGLLPSPMPTYEVDSIYWMIGHSLWILLTGLLLYAGFKKLFKKKTIIDSNATNSYLDAEPVHAYSGPEIHLPTKLLPNKQKYSILLLISIVFTLLGAWMIFNGDDMGYWAIGLFGVIGIPVFLMQIFTNKNYLELDSEKFTYSTFITKKTFYWKDVEAFDLWKIHNNKFVRWLPNANYQGEPVKPVVKSIVSKALMLPDTYGMKAEDLVEMMNEIRRRASI